MLDIRKRRIFGTFATGSHLKFFLKFFSAMEVTGFCALFIIFFFFTTGGRQRLTVVIGRDPVLNCLRRYMLDIGKRRIFEEAARASFLYHVR
uniref:Uncharacterized protein n=1 Tax=Trichuris muris TaxID=70415 RepID=A0A5S6QY12_TRIMR